MTTTKVSCYGMRWLPWVTMGMCLQGGRRDEGKSGSNKSIADKIVERSRRSVEVRKVSTSDRGNRRKSAPMPRRYVSWLCLNYSCQPSFKSSKDHEVIAENVAPGLAINHASTHVPLPMATSVYITDWVLFHPEGQGILKSYGESWSEISTSETGKDR